MNKLRLLMATMATAMFGTVLAPVLVHAVSPTTFNFTASELTNNWGPERIAPSGGVSSLGGTVYQGRTNVAEIRIDSTQAHPTEAYYRTEGIKTSKGLADNFSVPGNFGKSVQVDLYLDQAWDKTAVRAGLWTVGDNGANGTDPVNYPFGIIEFANVSGYKGFRVWDDSTTNGWKNVSGFAGFGNWVTFKITLDPAADQYLYSINGMQVAKAPSPTVSKYLYSVILNHRNFGLDNQDGLNKASYAVHWQGGVSPFTNKDQCKGDGWKASNNPVYKNQGDCVSSFASKGKS